MYISARGPAADIQRERGARDAAGHGPRQLDLSGCRGATPWSVSVSFCLIHDFCCSINNYHQKTLTLFFLFCLIHDFCY